jgi:hypothetical protein
MSSWLNQQYTAEELFQIFYSFNSGGGPMNAIPFRSWRVDSGTVINAQESNAVMSLRRHKALQYKKETDSWVAEPVLYNFVHPKNYNFWTITIPSDLPGQCLHSYSVASPHTGEHLTVKEFLEDDKYYYNVVGTTDYRLFQGIFKRYASPSADIREVKNSLPFWTAWLDNQPDTACWLPHVYSRDQMDTILGANPERSLSEELSELESWIIQFEVFAPTDKWESRIVRWKLAVQKKDATIWYTGAYPELSHEEV